MQNLFSENRMIGLRRAAAPESNERITVVSDAPAEGKKGLRSHLKNHKGKYILGLVGLTGAVLGGMYGMGKLGMNQAFHDGSWMQRNAPTWLTTGARNTASFSHRFTDAVDTGLQRIGIPGMQGTYSPEQATWIRENIQRGQGATTPNTAT